MSRRPKGITKEAWEEIKASTKVHVGSPKQEDGTPLFTSVGSQAPKFFTWDWKESPEEVLDSLTPVLKKLGVVLEQHDTGGDCYVCSVGIRAATEKEINDALGHDE